MLMAVKRFLKSGIHFKRRIEAFQIGRDELVFHLLMQHIVQHQDHKVRVSNIIHALHPLPNRLLDVLIYNISFSRFKVSTAHLLHIFTVSTILSI